MLLEDSIYLSLGFVSFCFVSIQAVSPCVFIGEPRLFAFTVVVEGSLLSLYGFFSCCAGRLDSW